MKDSRGRANILRVHILPRAKRAENFWGVVYPHICHSGGYNSYKERHTESNLTSCYDVILK